MPILNAGVILPLAQMVLQYHRNQDQVSVRGQRNHKFVLVGAWSHAFANKCHAMEYTVGLTGKKLGGSNGLRSVAMEICQGMGPSRACCGPVVGLWWACRLGVLALNRPRQKQGQPQCPHALWHSMLGGGPFLALGTHISSIRRRLRRGPLDHLKGYLPAGKLPIEPSFPKPPGLISSEQV